MVSLCKGSGDSRKQKHFLVKEGCTPPAGLQVYFHCLCVKLSLYTENVETSEHKLQSYIISLFYNSFHSEPKTLINAEISIISIISFFYQKGRKVWDRGVVQCYSNDIVRWFPSCLWRKPASVACQLFKAAGNQTHFSQQPAHILVVFSNLSLSPTSYWKLGSLQLQWTITNKWKVPSPLCL